MFRILITKDGKELANYAVSKSQVAGLYALAVEINKLTEHGYKIMPDPISKTKYVLQNALETVALELYEVPTVEPRLSALDLRNAALAVSSADEDTTPIAAIKAEAQ